MKHNIYLIKVTEKAHQPYDSYNAHVIIADNTKEVRCMCPSADEREETWLKPLYSKTKKIGITNRKKQVVLSSFRAG